MSDRSLRVALVGPFLGDRPGRAPSQGEVLARGLRGRGHAVIATSTVASPLPRLLDTLWTLARRRRDYDLAVVLVFSGRGFVVAELASLLLRGLRRPLALWLHGGALPDFARRQPRRVRRTFRRAAHLVAPSEYLARAFADLGPAVTVIENALPLADYPFRERQLARRQLAPRLLWMRTFHPLYRPEVALEALARLRASRPDATLTLAGNDEGLLASTRARASALGLADAVRFAGFLDPAAKARALDGHDLFLHTNAVDNAPVSLLEAGAAGLPIVATAVGGIPDLLADGENALVVADGSPAALAGRLAGAIERLLDDPALVARLIAGGRALAARASAQEIVPRWEALLARLVEDRR